jgi:hypothetical protein
VDTNELDPAARAFEALRQEVQAVGAQIASQGLVPDYAPTLVDIAERLKVIEASVTTRVPPPVYPAERVIAGHVEELKKQVKMLTTQRVGLEKLSARFRDRGRWIAGASGALFVLAIGSSLHITPDNWQWPEKAAAAWLGASVQDGGVRMLTRADPVGWNRLAEGYQLIEANQVIYEGCRRAAARANRDTVCKLKVASPANVAKTQ